MARLTYLTTTEFDFGAITHLAKILAGLGVSRPLVTTDKGLREVGIVDHLLAALGNEIAATVYDDTPENPTEDAVMAALALYQENGCDGVILLGGGSSMDLGKAVALLAQNGGELADHARARNKKVAPMVAVPTTSGTGSEVSVGFLITLNDGRKLTFISETYIPKVAVCDPELTLGLPPRLTAATGMDAVTHCIEAVLSPIVNPPAEAVGLDGLYRALRLGNLERAVADGADRDARWHMMMASSEGAMAFVKGLGAVHAMSHAAGRLKELRLHHGTLNAVILPVILRFNEEACTEKYARLREAIGLEQGADLAEWIFNLNQRIGIPRNLTEMGLTRDHMPGLIEHASADLATHTNPIKPTPEQYERLFEAAFAA